MISLVCCYNNIEQYDVLQKSLENQTVEYELIGIDNREGKYKSAASALNVWGSRAHGEYLVFLHQDILFLKKKIA